MCRDCNQKKGSRDFGLHLQIHPEMLNNAKKQASYISKFIINGMLDQSFKYWPIERAKSMYELSDGKININLKPYCKKALKAAEERQKQQQFDMDILSDKRTYLLDRQRSVEKRAKHTKDQKHKKQVKEINAQLRDINAEIQKLRSIRASEQEFINELNKILAS